MIKKLDARSAVMAVFLAASVASDAAFAILEIEPNNTITSAQHLVIGSGGSVEVNGSLGGFLLVRWARRRRGDHRHRWRHQARRVLAAQRGHDPRPLRTWTDFQEAVRKRRWRVSARPRLYQSLRRAHRQSTVQVACDRDLHGGRKQLAEHSSGRRHIDGHRAEQRVERQLYLDHLGDYRPCGAADQYRNQAGQRRNRAGQSQGEGQHPGGVAVFRAVQCA